MTYLPRAIPDRLIALSILPPPEPWQPPAPFGFGALIAEQTRPGEARFALHAHRFGAGYRPDALRERLQPLFTPDTMALAYYPVRENEPDADARRQARRMLAHVPRSGLRSKICACLPHHTFRSAGNLVGVELPGQSPTPLSRLHRITAEAQAI